MEKTLKSAALGFAFLSFVAAAYAENSSEKLSSALKNPFEIAELKRLASTDRDTALSLLTEALNQDKDTAYRCAAIEALASSKDEAVALALTAAINDPNPGVQLCAARVAGEAKNSAAVDALVANIESYSYRSDTRGPYENNLQARLKAINSIWSLGEIGNSKVMDKLAKFYSDSDDVIRINLIISMGKLQNSSKAGPYIKAIAASATETAVVRAAAFEMLEETGQESALPGLTPSRSDGIEKGDIIYTGGIVGSIGAWLTPDLPIGHAGIFAGTATGNGRIYVVIADCVPDNFKPVGGVRNINSFKNFTHQFKFPYYGNRTSKTRPTAAQREKIVALALKLGTTKGLHYSQSHASQKGHVDFDCVGYTEYLYEQAGLNPTDNSRETGLGWPLTPWEQFEATVPNTTHTSRSMDASQTMITPSNNAVEMLKNGLFGETGELAEPDTQITPAIAQ